MRMGIDMVCLQVIARLIPTSAILVLAFVAEKGLTRNG